MVARHRVLVGDLPENELFDENLAPFEPLSMIGESVQLRPLDPSDYGSLYWIEQDPTLPMALRRFAEATPPELFGQALWADSDTQFAIVSLADSTVVGVISLLQVNKRSGHGRLHVLIRQDLLGEVWPWESVGLFLDHVFVAHPLRKVYLDAAQSIFGLFAGGVDRVFFVEANLIGHEWCDGSWQDVFVLAFHRDHWMGLPDETRANIGQVFALDPPEGEDG